MSRISKILSVLLLLTFAATAQERTPRKGKEKICIHHLRPPDADRNLPIRLAPDLSSGTNPPMYFAGGGPMFEWNDSFSVGDTQIDNQHKQLFAIIAELHAAMKTGQSKKVLGQILDKLVGYTVRHFGIEEGMLRLKRYPELAQHKAIHEQFTAKIKQFQADHNSGKLMVSIELMNMLKDWLVDHIQVTDMKYSTELGLRA